MSLTDWAARFERLAALASIGGRRLLGLDTNPVPSDWTHITKVDPEPGKKLPLAYPLYLAHTSAVSVGGSRDVTDRNTEETFELATATGVPAVHEPSAPTHVTSQTREQSRFLAIPEVLNGDSEALVGTLGTGLDRVREDVGPDLIEEKLGFQPGNLLGGRLTDSAAAYLMQTAIFEAYIIMNTDSAAAREANVTEADRLSPRAARERALAAEYHLESEILYLEYSGTYGGSEAVDILEAVDDATAWSRLWYGGGLDDRERTEQMLDAGADAVVVGDVFHDIATVERDLVERARAEFAPDDATGDVPETETVEQWVENTVDGETSATRYLATIPAVDEPAQRATEYLAAAVELVLRLDALAADLTEPDAQTVRDALRERSLLAQARVTDLLDGGEDAVQRLSLGVLADRFDVDNGVAARHLAVTLRG
jgi:phosphoglycerol geranylgeranyltransferase